LAELEVLRYLPSFPYWRVVRYQTDEMEGFHISP